MQTFLPYEDFAESAKVLDRLRLGKQRVETYQILKTLLTETKSNAWKNHPAVKMWKGYECCLYEYQMAICYEWCSRGYKDTCLSKSNDLIRKAYPQFRKARPEWLGNKKLHASHRSNLLRKKPEHYSKFGWSEPDDLDYIWPV
jgi:hypothetical protein